MYAQNAQLVRQRAEKCRKIERNKHEDFKRTRNIERDRERRRIEVTEITPAQATETAAREHLTYRDELDIIADVEWTRAGRNNEAKQQKYCRREVDRENSKNVPASRIRAS